MYLTFVEVDYNFVNKESSEPFPFNDKCLILGVNNIFLNQPKKKTKLFTLLNYIQMSNNPSKNGKVPISTSHQLKI